MTADRVEPNPHSPYATASPVDRHMFPVPLPGARPPRAGTLTTTGCGELAVVPAAPIEIMPGEPLPPGVCIMCAVARATDRPHARSGPATRCDICNASTVYDRLCRSCRQIAHATWSSAA